MSTLFTDVTAAGTNRDAGEFTPEEAVPRVAPLGWQRIGKELDEQGSSLLPGVLSREECQALADVYPENGLFRSRVVMGRHGFGRGEYKYFSYPLPQVIQELRTALYSRLAPVANGWNIAMGIDVRYPDKHHEFLQRCHNAGQLRPTPLLLQYGEGDYNCLHQDLYGDVVFPLQITCFLSRRGVDYEGGDFLLVEQRPRAQSRGEAIATEQGEIVIFTTRHRPVEGTRGVYRAAMRHGVSRVTRGLRYTLGVIFHDAK